jgi:hypothetical protein
MRTFFLSSVIGLAAGVIFFFLSVAFLCLVLLIGGAMTHSHPDMTLAIKAAAPVAVLAAITGFVATLVRSLRRRPA